MATLTGLKLCVESADSGEVPPFFGAPSLQNVLSRHEEWLEKARTNVRTLRLEAARISEDDETSIGGLHEAAAALHIGTERIGVLRIGQVLTSQPNSRLVSEFANTWFGAERLPDEIRIAILQLPVMSPERWSAAVWLLERVANFLGSEGLRVVASTGGIEPEPVARARDYISKHFLEEDLSLPRIAAAVGVTPNYLSHVYRKHTSLSVTESVNRLRIEHAVELLNQGRRRVSDVGRACGFGSLSQFNRSFRRYVGQSPTSFKVKGFHA